ncbi:MAG: 3-ketoacyl-ACP reductase [Verrucomicrobiales bacterium]|nr:3-ketoacyl-ACP reductase [Verrucomicrobiales bacterium]
MNSPLPPAVLVTGSSRGLGKGIALELARAGMSVAIHYGSNEAAARETAAQCREVALHASQLFPIIRADLNAAAERDGLMEETLSALGRLDALVNNAGITSPGRADVLDNTEEAWDEVMDVNLKAPWFLSQKAARWWVANGDGPRLEGGYKLVFVSSVSAEMASMNRGDYCISKAGIGMMAKVFALRLAAHGVQVVEFRPGIMETDMTAGVKEKYDPIISGGKVPMRRWGQPSDVGRAVKSFLNGGLPFSTGGAIYLDGGLNLPLL